MAVSPRAAIVYKVNKATVDDQDARRDSLEGGENRARPTKVLVRAAIRAPKGTRVLASLSGSGTYLERGLA